MAIKNEMSAGQIFEQKIRIKNQINRCNKDIADLTDKKIQYENMRIKISQAVQKLQSGKKNVLDSKEQLKIAYVSTASDKECVKYENTIDDIEILISELNNTILPEINKEISSINSKIMEKKRTIQILNNQLYLLNK